ncbi:MAG: Asd/ArgC dimerization domain-containing protein [Acidobacteriota bacterium]
MSVKYKTRVALVGTDSMSGKEMLEVLTRKEFPVEKAEFFDPNIEGDYSKLTQFKGEPRVVNALNNAFLDKVDLVFLASDKNTNAQIGAKAEKKKVFAIDLSGAFWEKEEVPVVVSGINDEEISEFERHLVANPHPVTIMLAHILGEAVQKFGVKKTVAFVLQPVSAFGKSGVEELASQSADILNRGSSQNKVFKAQIAFNLLSQSESVDESGFSEIERRILSELKRVLKKNELSISLVQAPVFHGYSVMVYMELDKKAEIKSLEETYRKSSLFKCYSPSLECPVSPALTAGKDEIYIGQVKKDIVSPSGFWVWAVADNLTVGSALNAYEIALNMVSEEKSLP